ncbi:MAG: hypothetical protein LQ338_006304 [Usnochroma carphineum]|nr:MAG: hypothetical protein LQ338_006304 [Usnochroma carphineum]
MDHLPPPLLEGLVFEKSNWCNRTVADDPFYIATSDSPAAAPGTLLKVEEDTDTSRYTIPAGIALSRFVYQSETLTGSPVPVSAIVLWPYSPRSQADGYQVVAWAHGTSGITAEFAPSHHKNLWQHFQAPYQLALQGYVVVATDYAGLGIGKDASGDVITHAYLACPSHANDVVYSVQAAQSAFPSLSKDFVVIGHSQGGGAAWATSQRQAVKPVAGFLGAVAVSPVTDVFEEPEPIRSMLVTALCPGIAHEFPDIDLSAILTPDGQQRLGAVQALRAGTACALALLSDCNLLRPESEWKQNPRIQEYRKRIVNGGKEVGGPLLVIHGESDPRLSSQLALAAAKKTVELHPASSIDTILLPHVTHAPALTAGQRIWMDWIADRFAGRVVHAGHRQSRIISARLGQSYLQEQNWFLAPATKFFHVP